MTKAALIGWEQQFTSIHTPTTVNLMLVTGNGFLHWQGLGKLAIIRLLKKLKQRNGIAEEAVICRLIFRSSTLPLALYIHFNYILLSFDRFPLKMKSS